MKRINFYSAMATMLVVIALAGTTFAQPSVPSLVTQQLRLSSGSGTYVNLRAGTGPVGSDASPYFLDNAPTPPVATESYALWLDGSNHIRQSIKFQPVAGAPGSGIGGPGYLYRVNAAGTGTEWVLPSDITDANNGLVADKVTTPGTTIVQLGGATSAAGAAVPFTSDRFVNLATHGLNFEGGGAFNVGATGAVTNMIFDQGTTGTITMPNVPATATPLATDKLLFLDAAGNQVHTRLISSLVNADQGLVLDVSGAQPTVLLGSAAGDPANPFLADRVVSVGAHALTFAGAAGNLNIGNGTAVLNTTIDPGVGGTLKANNIPAQATPLATDAFMIIDPTATNQVKTRLLSSLVDANNGLTIDNTTTPGTAIVQLGGQATGTGNLLHTSFIGMSNQTLNFEGDGTYNLGTTGNIAFNVKTGTSAMTLQGANLASANSTGVTNFAYVNTTTNEVHTMPTTALTASATAIDFIAIDPTTNEIVKAQPTAGIYRGHVSWTGWTQTITLAAGQAIPDVTKVSVVATIDNRASAGTIGIQVTSITAGTPGSFTIETTDVPTAGSFISYTVMNF